MTAGAKRRKIPPRTGGKQRQKTTLRPATRRLVAQMLAGDRRALARLMSLAENRHEDALAVMNAVSKRAGGSRRIGLTGPPGSGKSTLADKLIARFRAMNLRVGVVAVDPSSPFSGGALLGDRIRMQRHGTDEKVFIRSLGSRGSHGGLSRAATDIVQLLEAFGCDVVLIETVGVGQTELDIMAVAGTTVVVLVPESGDTVQTMKAGLMEIADIFVVNKADREGAERLEGELQALAGMSPRDGWVTPVIRTVATREEGVDELVEAFSSHSAFRKTRERLSTSLSHPSARPACSATPDAPNRRSVSARALIR